MYPDDPVHEMSVSDASTVKRWRFQFTLRTIAVTVVLLALPCAWLGHQYRQGQLADSIVQKLGGTSVRWWHWDWRWGRTVGATMQGVPISDADLGRLATIQTLGWLDLSGTHITDEGVVHLQKLEGLSSLDLSDTQITDKGLEHIEHLENLVMLQCHRTSVSDEGVARLKKALPNLDVYYAAP